MMAENAVATENECVDEGAHLEGVSLRLLGVQVGSEPRLVPHFPLRLLQPLRQVLVLFIVPLPLVHAEFQLGPEIGEETIWFMTKVKQETRTESNCAIPKVIQDTFNQRLTLDGQNVTV